MTPQNGAEPVARPKEAQLMSSQNGIQPAARLSERSVFFQPEKVSVTPVWPEEIDLDESVKHEKKAHLTIKKTTSDSLSKGLKKRSLKKARQLDMPPTPIGHDWHLTDG